MDGTELTNSLLLVVIITPDIVSSVLLVDLLLVTKLPNFSAGTIKCILTNLIILILQSCCPSCRGCGVRRAASSAQAPPPPSFSSFRCNSSWSASRPRRRVSSWRRPETPPGAAAEPMLSSIPIQLLQTQTPAPLTIPTPVPTRVHLRPTHSIMHIAPSFYSAGGTIALIFCIYFKVLKIFTLLNITPNCVYCLVISLFTSMLLSSSLLLAWLR